MSNLKIPLQNCVICRVDKSIDSFRSKSNYHLIKNYCDECGSKRIRKSDREKQERMSGHDRDKYIYADCKKADLKKDLHFNLDRSFIRDLIAPGCSYCGETDIRYLSLDRIDNSKGHTKDNVVAGCMRCNYVRGDMPYEAWLLLAPKMREARENDLFGDWHGPMANRARQKAAREVVEQQLESNHES